MNQKVPFPKVPLAAGFASIVALLLLSFVANGGSVPGPRKIYYVYDTATKTADQSRLVINLQDGTANKRLTDNGHTILCYPAGTLDHEGKPDVVGQLLKKAYEGRTLPAVVVCGPTGAVIGCESLPATAGVNEFYASISRFGATLK